MTKHRPTLHLKLRRSLPELSVGQDPLSDLLDQPATTDPFHPHLAVKPSTDVERDLELMRDLIYALELRRRNAEKVSQTEADSWAHQLSGLVCRVKNRLAE